MIKSKYINPVEFENNKDFYVPHDIVSALYKKNPPESYKVIEIKVGRIRRTVNGTITNLYETLNYRYLTNKNDPFLRKKYEDYCKNSENTFDNPLRSVDTFCSVEEDISREEYDIHKGAIIVNQYNVVQDGLHRSCIILKNHGPKYKIKVLRVVKKTQKKMIIVSPLFELKEYVKGLYEFLQAWYKHNKKNH